MSERVDEKQFVCVICPNSCRLTVWRDRATNEVKVEGNQCPRGKVYGTNVNHHHADKKRPPSGHSRAIDQRNSENFDFPSNESHQRYELRGPHAYG